MSRDYELLMEKIENAYTRLRALKNAHEIIRRQSNIIPSVTWNNLLNSEERSHLDKYCRISQGLL